MTILRTTPEGQPTTEPADDFDHAIAAQKKAATQTQQLVEQAAASFAMPENGSTQAPPSAKTPHKPRTTIAIPLPDGSVARHLDDYNAGGVNIRIDHPDEAFRPSAHVNEPLKEEHGGRNKMRRDQGKWRKNVRNNPVAERLDAENRFNDMVNRPKGELESNAQER